MGAKSLFSGGASLLKDGDGFKRNPDTFWLELCDIARTPAKGLSFGFSVMFEGMFWWGSLSVPEKSKSVFVDVIQSCVSANKEGIQILWLRSAQAMARLLAF